MNIETLVISMANAHDRRRVIQENLDRAGFLNWKFVDGLTGNCQVGAISVAPKDDQINHFGRILTSGEIGCFKSHYQIILNHSTKKDGWILVLEDDIILDDNFKFEELIYHLEEMGIKYCRLFSKAYKSARQVAMMSGFREIIRYDLDPFGTQAYLIHTQAARAFIRNTKTIVRPIDDELGRFWEHGLIPYAVFPFPVIERAVPSAIAQDRDLGDNQRRPTFWRQLHRAWDKTRRIAYRLRHYR